MSKRRTTIEVAKIIAEKEGFSWENLSTVDAEDFLNIAEAVMVKVRQIISATLAE